MTIKEWLSIKKNTSFAFLIVILFGGIAMILYPVIGNWYAEQEQSAVQARYDDTVAELDDTETQEALEAAQLYNDLLYRIQSSQEYIEPENYEDLLNLSGNGAMGYVEIPIIDVMLPIYHGVGEEALAKGAGHMLGTSLPVGGEGTHAVISAHAGLPSARLFTDLETLQVGDVFYIHVLGNTLTYEVDQIVVTVPSDTEAVQIEAGKDYVTLLTCTPYGVNTHRLLVRGRRVELSSEEVITAVETTNEPESSTWMQKYFEGIIVGLITTLCVLLLLGLILFLRKRRKGKMKS